jgi:hypothetical protein
MGGGGVTPRILNLRTRRRWVANSWPCRCATGRQSSRQYKSLGGLKNQPARNGSVLDWNRNPVVQTAAQSLRLPSCLGSSCVSNGLHNSVKNSDNLRDFFRTLTSLWNFISSNLVRYKFGGSGGQDFVLTRPILTIKKLRYLPAKVG